MAGRAAPSSGSNGGGVVSTDSVMSRPPGIEKITST
jgi:hypothetical protein